MNEIKPEAYVLNLDMENGNIVALSGFKTYNETNSITTDLKAFIDYRFKEDKNLIIFQGTKEQLLNNKMLMEKFKNVEEKIKELKETNYLLIVGNI